MLTIKTLLAAGAARLAEAGVDAPRRTARVLAQYLLGWDDSEAIRRANQVLDAGVRQEFDALLARRMVGEPLQYITGQVAFCDLVIKCDERVLVPRPETEILAHEALAALAELNLPAARVLDIGTGSGALALTIKHSVPTANVLAVDISGDALAVARLNAAQLGLAVKFCESDVFASVAGKFDLIVSNPPYIIREVLPNLQREVQREPQIALDGGADGLEVVRPLLRGLPQHLSRGGVALIEIDPPVSDGAQVLARELLPERNVSVQNDYNALARILKIE